MYTAINGIYENGQFVLTETPTTSKKTEVVIMFMEEVEALPKNKKKGVKLGSLAGKGYRIPDNFNEPLDDLKDYM